MTASTPPSVIGSWVHPANNPPCFAPGLPPAVIRDQKPMKFIAEKIDPRSALAEYLTAINSQVFFWASP